MPHLWLVLADIPAEGRDFLFEDQEIWAEPARELGPEMEILSPLTARVRLTPRRGEVEGCLVEGAIEGRIQVPCDRCTEPAEVQVEARFQEFEELDEDDESLEGDARMRLGPRGAELEIAALLWEQFLLGLPVKPLCRESCKGLCPRCGRNLNLGMCACSEEDEDPRMSPLRNLKLS